MAKLITHVGQTLWRRDEMGRRRQGYAGEPAYVLKVGRLWAKVGARPDADPYYGWSISVETLVVQDGTAGQGDHFYLSREAWEDEAARNAVFTEIRQVIGGGPCPCSLANARRALAILKGEEPASDLQKEPAV